MPNDKQPTPGHVAVLTNQLLVYRHRQVIPRIVILRIESVAKMPKLSPGINLGISSDLRITNPSFLKPGISVFTWLDERYLLAPG